MGIEIPIDKNERDLIEPKISEFCKLISMLPENIRAYVYMEFTKRNNKDMVELKEKFTKKIE